MRVRLLPALGTVLFLLVSALPAYSGDAGRDLVVIKQSAQSALEEHDIPVIWRGASFFLGEWNENQQARVRDLGIPFQVLLRDVQETQQFYLFELDDDQQPPAAWSGRMLYRTGRSVVIAVGDDEAQEWLHRGFHPVRLGHTAHGWARPSRADFVAYDCTSKPVIADLLGQASQAKWMDWIEKLSGVESVVVSGVTRTIQTRFSSSLFNGAANAKAYDFVLQQAQSFHYPAGNIEQDPFTGTGGQTWKNLVLTIPGQTSPGSEVLLTGHFDSVLQSGDSTTSAPGANDNGTGSATLLETARILRQYRFERTVKIIFFTGEEQGLFGSEAYTSDHSMAPILGVVNLDMFGWDGNGDRCFEIHAGTLTQSQDVGNCFQDSIGSYGLGLSHDYLTTTATDRSDHASFWTANVGAIEIAENYFNDNVGGCVGSDPNPFYHTNNDTIASNLTPSYGFDIAKSALATISAMAIPIQACFTSAPSLSATPGVAIVDLSWTSVPGASTYRVYRSTQGCEGQWFEVGETASTSVTDTGATQPTSHFYYVEAVDGDGFCVSPQSNCSSATPTIYHASATGASTLDVCASGGPGNGNGLAEPGEMVTMPVTLQNDGNTTLTSIAGVLSSTTPGVTVVDPNAGWPNLGPGASSLSSPDHFGFYVGTGVPCGTLVAANIALAYAEGTNPASRTVQVGTTQQTLLMNEGFSAGIPAGWSVVNGGSGGAAAATWTTSNPGGRSIGAPLAPPFAIVDSDNAGTSATQDEQLVTPAIDASGCASLSVEFSNQFRWYSGGLNEIADVDVSTNGGSSWANVLRMQGASNGYSTPNTRTVDVTSAIAPNPSNVKIRFHYYQGQFEWWWAIDNVKVSCAAPVCNVCTAPPGPPGEPGLSAPVTLSKSAGDLVIDWTYPPGPCVPLGFAVYRGDLGTLQGGAYSHDTALICGVGSPSFSIPLTDPQLGDADYFLVVADNGTEEGSYGRASSDSERPVSAAACKPTQNLATCP